MPQIKYTVDNDYGDGTTFNADFNTFEEYISVGPDDSRENRPFRVDGADTFYSTYPVSTSFNTVTTTFSASYTATTFTQYGSEDVYQASLTARLEADTGGVLLDFSDIDDNVSLTGGDFGDSILGSSGNNTLRGGMDDDTLRGGAGNDSIDGGGDGDRGGDTAQYSGRRSDYTITSSNGGFLVVDNRTEGPDGADTVTGVEAFSFSDGTVRASDLIPGTPNPPNPPGPTSGNDNLNGTEGSDIVSLLAGNDTYRGGDGADSINGDAGNDRLYGDDGNDTISAGTGNDYARGGDDNDKLSGGEGNDRLYGDAGRDSLDGNNGNDYLRGGDGSDTINGGTGNDRLYGDGGRDFLDGGTGNDYLDGGEGPDVLIGGPGNDVLRGGAGADRYVFGPDSGAHDIIRGFSKAEGDRLDLKGQGYTVSFAGDGDAVLTLASGATVRLDGVNEQEFGDGKGYFVS